MSVYYGQSPVAPYSYVAAPSQPPTVVYAGRPQVVAAPPTVVIDHGRRSRRFRSSRRRGYSRSKSPSIRHKHTVTHKFNLRGKSRRKNASSRRGKSKRRITMSIGDEYVMEKASLRMEDLEATGTPLEVFLHSNLEHAEETDHLLGVQWLMASTYQQAETLGLQLSEGDNLLFSASAVFRRQVTERTIDIEYTDFEAPVDIAMNGTLEFRIGGAEPIKVFVADTTNALSSFRVALYNDTHSDTYAHYQLPVVYATLFLRFNSATAAYTLTNVVLTVDFIPERTTVPTTSTHIDVLPTLQTTPLDVVRWGGHNENRAQAVHAAFSKLLHDKFVEKTDRTSQWHHVSNGGDSGSTASRAHTVLWGPIVDTLLAHAILEDVSDEQLDKVEHLVSALNGTENGRTLITLVARLYQDLHPESGMHVQQSFPTLRQVLRHTTGLPNNGIAKHENIVAYYESMVSRLNNPDDAELSDDEREAAVDTQISNIIAHLNESTSAIVDPDVIVGQSCNVFESLILFMYIRSMKQQWPLDLLKAHASSKFTASLEWGLDTPTDADNPLSLSTCAQSTFEDLVKYTHVSMKELERQNGALARGLLNPVYVNNEAAIARTLGWSVFRAAKNIDVFFSLQGERSMLDATLIYMIPELRIYGVVNEHNADFSRPLCFDARFFIKSLIKTLNAFEFPADVRPRYAIEHLPYAVYSRRYVKEAVLDRHATLAGSIYSDPFIDSVTGKNAQITLERDEESGDLILVGVDGVHRLHLGYTGQDDVFFKLDEPYVNGSVVLITPEFVSIGCRFFLAKQKVEDLTMGYRKALSFSQKRISSNIHDTARQQSIRSIRPHTLIASQFFADKVGARFHQRGWRGGWRRPYYRRGGWGYGLAAAASVPLAVGLAAQGVYPPYYAGYPYPPYPYY